MGNDNTFIILKLVLFIQRELIVIWLNYILNI
jgi:hypothetical protein